MDKKVRLRSLFTNPYRLIPEQSSLIFLSSNKDAVRSAMKQFVLEKNCRDDRTIVIDEKIDPLQGLFDHEIFYDKETLEKVKSTKVSPFVYPIARLRPERVFYVDVAQNELRDSFQLAATGHYCIFSFSENSVFSFWEMLKGQEFVKEWKMHLDVFERYIELNDAGEITAMYAVDEKTRELICLYCV